MSRGSDVGVFSGTAPASTSQNRPFPRERQNAAWTLLPSPGVGQVWERACPRLVWTFCALIERLEVMVTPPDADRRPSLRLVARHRVQPRSSMALSAPFDPEQLLDGPRVRIHKPGSEVMIQQASVVGIDVAKARFDVFIGTET